MVCIHPAVLVIGLALSSSRAAVEDTERVLVAQEAREALIEMKATVHHGSAGGDFTADLTRSQVATLRRLGYSVRATPGQRPRGGDLGVEAMLAGWTPYAQMRGDFMAYAASHPGIAEYCVIGHSVQGREIFGLRISDNAELEEDEPEVVFWANIHGDEFASGEIAYGWAMELLDAYGIDPVATSYVDDNEIWVIPLLNPDGHELGTRSNANGVDLNRDFGWNWDGWGSSSSAYSQVETRALQEFCLENNVNLSVTMHCSGNVFLYPWCHSPHDSPEDTLVQTVGSLYSVAANYQLIKSWADYETHGELLDLIHGGHGSLCYTAEISNSLTSYADSYARNKAGMDKFCGAAGRGLHGLVTDAQSGQPVRAAVYVSGSPYPAYSDPVVGDVHRMALPGTYDVTVWASGYAPETVQGIQVTAAAPGQFQVALQRGGGEHAFFVNAVNQRDPFNSYNNTTPASHALGAPDGLACSLGSSGFIVLDMGAGNAITDGPGDDFTVTEALVPGDPDLERYSVFVGDAYDQNSALGMAKGTASFDLADAAVSSTRYVRIVSGPSPDPDDPLAGMELDGITALNSYQGYFVDIGPGTGGAFGTPALAGAGDLSPAGAGFTLNITDVAPDAAGMLFVSLAEAAVALDVVGVSFYLAIPWALQIPVQADATGAASLPGNVGINLAGMDISCQCLWLDASGPAGVATATNGLRLEIP